jgi:Rrf2 family protein
MHMLLSQTAVYALRAVAWIAAYSPDRAVLARDLSAGTGIPAQYLSKILRRLVLAGVLDSRRGRGGGFTLARSPRKIAFSDVLSAVDAHPQEGRCAFAWGRCKASDPCPLHDSWSVMSDRFRRWAAGSAFDGMRAVPGRRMARRSRKMSSRRD